jgi:cell division septum initiation protein DivIVA
MGKEKEPPTSFSTVRKGLDPVEVDAFVAAAKTSVSSLQEQLSELSQADTPAPEGEAQAPADRLTRFLTLAEEQTAAVIAEAKAEARSIASEAKRQADQVVAEARADAERSVGEAESALQQAREESDRAIAGLEERRRTMFEELEAMRSRLLSLLPDIERVLESSALEDDPTAEA